MKAQRDGHGMSQKTILYVEDNEFNRKIVRQLLAKTRYKLREAHDGESAVKDALDGSARPHPDGRAAAEDVRPRRDAPAARRGAHRRAFPSW